MSLNRCTFIGNAGKDAELRYTANGTASAQFSLAVSNPKRNADGSWEERPPEWVNVVLWGDVAERLSQRITKGTPLYVEGRLQTRTWDDDQGKKHYRTEVHANKVEVFARAPRTDDGTSGGDGLPWDE